MTPNLPNKYELLSIINENSMYWLLGNRRHDAAKSKTQAHTHYSTTTLYEQIVLLATMRF